VLLNFGAVPSILTLAGILSIGGYQYTGYPNTNYAQLIGSIDTFRFWSRSLTHTECLNTKSNLNLVASTNLYYSYNFDQQTGTTISDYSGGGRHLYMTNTLPSFELDYALCF
jgi:hypothetical protein